MLDQQTMKTLGKICENCTKIPQRCPFNNILIKDYTLCWAVKSHTSSHSQVLDNNMTSLLYNIRTIRVCFVVLEIVIKHSWIYGLHWSSLFVPWWLKYKLYFMTSSFWRLHNLKLAENYYFCFIWVVEWFRFCLLPSERMRYFSRFLIVHKIWL